MDDPSSPNHATTVPVSTVLTSNTRHLPSWHSPRPWVVGASAIPSLLGILLKSRRPDNDSQLMSADYVSEVSGAKTQPWKRRGFAKRTWSDQTSLSH